MPKPPTVTLGQVERVARFGVWRVSEQHPWMVASYRFERLAAGNLSRDTLSQQQIVERLNDWWECEDCGGTGRYPRELPRGGVRTTCPRCNGLGYLDPDPQLRALFVVAGKNAR